MRAVLFDLFGTLIPNLAATRIAAATRDVAEILGAPLEAVAAELMAQFPLRITGAIQDGPEQFDSLARNLGLNPSRQTLARAARRYRALIDESIQPRPGALEALRTLRARDFALGLVTDCSSGTAETVERSTLGPLFGVMACSAILRTRKPDARMYLHATELLGVSPGDCVYVGDGNSQELEGARALGMITVWIDNRVPGHFAEADHRVQSPTELIDLPPLREDP